LLLLRVLSNFARIQVGSIEEVIGDSIRELDKAIEHVEEVDAGQLA
jgi:hypothetical protein